jgi:hypothetical protein
MMRFLRAVTTTSLVTTGQLVGNEHPFNLHHQTVNEAHVPGCKANDGGNRLLIRTFMQIGRFLRGTRYLRLEDSIFER